MFQQLRVFYSVNLSRSYSRVPVKKPSLLFTPGCFSELNQRIQSLDSSLLNDGPAGLNQGNPNTIKHLLKRQCKICISPQYPCSRASVVHHTIISTATDKMLAFDSRENGDLGVR